jgi:hypothetical protein
VLRSLSPPVPQRRPRAHETLEYTRRPTLTYIRTAHYCAQKTYAEDAERSPACCGPRLPAPSSWGGAASRARRAPFAHRAVARGASTTQLPSKLLPFSRKKKIRKSHGSSGARGARQCRSPLPPLPPPLSHRLGGRRSDESPLSPPMPRTRERGGSAPLALARTRAEPAYFPPLRRRSPRASPSAPPTSRRGWGGVGGEIRRGRAAVISAVLGPPACPHGGRERGPPPAPSAAREAAAAAAASDRKRREPATPSERGARAPLSRRATWAPSARG